MTTLLGITTGRARGMDVERCLKGLSFTEAALRAGQATVPWEEAVRFWTGMRAQLSDAEVPQFAAQWSTTHPLMRIVGQLMASTNAWLDVFWKLSANMNAAIRLCTYELHADEHVLRAELHEGLTPCPVWFELTHHVACLAPLACGDAPLTTLSTEWDGTYVYSRFAAPPQKDLAERLERASGVPLQSVFDSLVVFGDAVGDLLHDGHFAFDPAVRAQVDEVATLAMAWGLTLTEARVALRLAEGAAPAEIATALGVAVGTVRVHLKSIYAKTDTAGQRELVSRLRAWRLP